MSKNTNVLQGFRCPYCKSYGPFAIAYTTVGIFSDDGREEDCGDSEWDDENYCRCIECGTQGTVKIFTAKPRRRLSWVSPPTNNM